MEAHLHPGPPPQLAVDVDLGVVVGRSVLDDGQAQAGAAGGPGAGLVHPVEAVEHLGQLVLRDAYAGVGHLQQHLVPVPAHGDKHTAAGEVIFDGIFDEVEAALDQANVERFAKYISHFRGGSQFIVVTHRPGTMAQCDALYGVTMKQNGVSSLLKVQLHEAIQYVDRKEVNA